ncbi:hypothetical protein PoB_002447900 [Plakobranchus ocellatus]|uniref:Uncharacterized protein n=1 Tax=Plakobranchus ocellatus TaxID=259542 RepID=A0AAV3ZVP2_9GAST|nr:hypothetical protein PoB_002447900 [Plakobranchus ocellatus]
MQSETSSANNPCTVTQAFMESETSSTKNPCTVTQAFMVSEMSPANNPCTVTQASMESETSSANNPCTVTQAFMESETLQLIILVQLLKLSWSFSSSLPSPFPPSPKSHINFPAAFPSHSQSSNVRVLWEKKRRICEMRN